MMKKLFFEAGKMFFFRLIEVKRNKNTQIRQYEQKQIQCKRGLSDKINSLFKRYKCKVCKQLYRLDTRQVYTLQP